MDGINELKGLSDAADIIINKVKFQNERFSKWFEIMRQTAINIVDSSETFPEGASSNPKSYRKIKIPDIVLFVTETEKLPKEKQRISTALAHLQKDHIVHAKRRSSRFALKDSHCEKVNTSEQSQETAFNETFVKGTSPDNSLKVPNNESSKIKSDITLNKDGDEEFFTPIQNKHEILQLHGQRKSTAVKSDRSSLKRKSSSPLSKTVSVKKAKATRMENAYMQKKSLKKSLKGRHGKCSGGQHSRIPSVSKISVSGANSSVLKENRVLRKKPENDEGNQPLKKVLALRQIKIQEAKRKREEKMQKTSQQRLKLEKEKDERLRSRQTREVEKSLLKTVLEPKKTRSRDIEKNGNSEVKSGPPSIKKLKTNLCATPKKTPLKKITMQNGNKEKQSMKEDMNATYSTKPSSLEVKEIFPKDTKAIGHAKAEFPKTPMRMERVTSASTTSNGPVKVPPKNIEPATPSALQQNQSKISNLTTSINTQSYEMTPARSSYVNYDISEIRSDDSDDEEPKSNPKPFPAWASGVRLRNALVQQQYHPIDSDLLFGNVFDCPNLSDIMGVQNKKYFKRTSSAIWNSPSAFK